MIRRRRLRYVLVAGLTLAACLGALRFKAESPVAADNLPAQIDDEAFWRMISEFSEPGGYFRSDNFLSNENSFQYVISRLTKSVSPGGVYLGVGPEQNFTYLVALRPKLAFIIDIRRQNTLEHLLYKALIELSANRAEFLSRLFSRTSSPGLGANTSAEALFEACKGAQPSRERFRQNLQAVQGQGRAAGAGFPRMPS